MGRVVCGADNPVVLYVSGGNTQVRGNFHCKRTPTRTRGSTSRLSERTYRTLSVCKKRSALTHPGSRGWGPGSA